MALFSVAGYNSNDPNFKDKTLGNVVANDLLNGPSVKKTLDNLSTVGGLVSAPPVSPLSYLSDTSPLMTPFRGLGFGPKLGTLQGDGDYSKDINKIMQPGIIENKQQPIITNNTVAPINSVKPILDNNGNIGLQNNQLQTNRSQYTGPIQTLFGSANFSNSQNQGGQGNQYNTDSGDMFGNFKFNQDTYNQGLRDTSTQGYKDSRENYIKGAGGLFNMGINDALNQSLLNNQYRQDMRKSQADFTNANSLASQNLQQQNDSGLKDLINQRSSYFDQGRLDNDTSRLGLEQQRVNQAQNQNNVDNQYKYDYLNQYLQPQMQNQVENQRAQLNQNAQIHASDIQKGNILGNIQQGIQSADAFKQNATQEFMQTPLGQGLMQRVMTGQTPPEGFQAILNDYINKKQLNDSNQTENQNMLNGNLSVGRLYGIGQQDVKNQGSEEIKNMLDSEGKIMSTEQTIKKPYNSNSVAKSTTK